jgi:hypothetical protein
MPVQGINAAFLVDRRNVMDDADYWRDQAAKFRERAKTAEDPALHEELLDLAAVCEEVADTIEARTPSG